MMSLPIRSSSAVPRNLEIKVRVADLAPARATAARLGACPAGVEVQVDRYYELEGGSRLKLRTVPGRPPELIRYRRPESDAVRTSDYELTPVRDAEARRCLVPKTRPVVGVPVGQSRVVQRGNLPLITVTQYTFALRATAPRRR